MFNYHVYVHIPFCKRRCPYCCFTAQYNKSEFTNLALIDDYIEALRKDFSNTEFPDGNITSIVFGGGTPSLLSGSQLERILDGIKQKISLEKYEKIKYMGYEVSPETASQDTLEAYRRNGFNRVSIGVQSFIDSELKLLGRPYTRDMIMEAVKRVRNENYEVVNIDLLIGIPGQTFNSCIANIKEAVSLKFEHISINIFYSLYQGGKEYLDRCKKKNENDESMNLEEKLHLYEEACNYLLSQGYERVDNTVFTLPKSKLQKDVTSDTDHMLAFGPGSSGFLGKEVRYTLPSIGQYIKEQKVEYEPITMKKHAFAIVWIQLISNRMLKEEVTIDLFEIGIDELRSKNKDIDNLISALISEGVAFFEGTTFKIDEKSMNKAIIIMQYIRGGNG